MSKKQKKLNSVLKNVPLSLMDTIRKYSTKNSNQVVRWKFREPKKGEKYGWGGSLRRENAQSADMYVDTDRTQWVPKWQYEQAINRSIELEKENHAQQEKIAEQLRACQEYSVELEKVRRAMRVFDRRQGGDRRSD